MTAIGELSQKALASDAQDDWHRVWQTFAGMRLVVPISQTDGDTLHPGTMILAGTEAVTAYPDMDRFAESLNGASEYAEMDGTKLAELLAEQDTAVAVLCDPPVLVTNEALAWITATYGARVAYSDGAGLSIAPPDGLTPELVATMGEIVGALGADCPEAWLVGMAEADGRDELLLILGLSDGLRDAEAGIAETVTRSIQATTERPVAVACPDRGSGLMAMARKTGIGIGG